MSCTVASMYLRQRGPLNLRTTTGPHQAFSACPPVMCTVARLTGSPRCKDRGQNHICKGARRTWPPSPRFKIMASGTLSPNHRRSKGVGARDSGAPGSARHCTGSMSTCAERHETQVSVRVTVTKRRADSRSVCISTIPMTLLNSGRAA